MYKSVIEGSLYIEMKVFNIMVTKKGTKAVIIGAGAVGSTIAYVMAIRTQVHELVLVDVNAEKAEGEVMDISHGLPFLGDMNIYAAGYEAVKDADIIVITAGASQKPGESRIDLVARNARIGKSIADSIKPHYNGGLVLVVANPVDVLTYKYQEWLDIPHNMVIGSGTVLDSIRFRYLLGERLNVDVKYIHAYIIGEHGDSQFPAWSATNISGFSIDDYCRANDIELSPEDREAIAKQTREAANDIIARKGATYYGIGISTSTIIESLMNPMASIRTVSTRLHGEYGMEDVVVSVPALISKSGIEKVPELTLPTDEMWKLKQSAKTIRAVLDEIKDY